MPVFIGYETAWDYWKRTGIPMYKSNDYADPMPKINDRANTIFATYVPNLATEIKHDINMFNLKRPLDVLVNNKNSRRRSEPFACKVINCSLPRHSFLEITPRLYITSPELTFIQMASNTRLPFAELILRGFELCGGYMRIQYCSGNYELHERRPITSVHKIKSYLDEIRELNKQRPNTVRGAKRASSALCYVIDGSASPMESMLTMLLCLPKYRGGFGLPKPLLNECMIDGEIVRRATDRHYLVGDLLWPEDKVDLEYESDAWHRETNQRRKDDMKRNALLDHGFTVYSANFSHIKDPDKCEVLASQIRRALHIYKPPKTDEERQKQRSLQETLLRAEGISI